MESLIEQAKSLVNTADEADRKKLIDAFTDLTYSIESPQDTMQRVFYQHMRIAVARIGCDLKIFQILSDSPHSLTATELAVKIDAAPLLTSRLLRYMSSIRYIQEDDKDTYSATNITRALTLTGAEGGIYHYFDSYGPAIQSLPEFLKEHKYQDITEVTNTPLQKGHDTDLPAFLWVFTLPHNHAAFNQFMAGGRIGMPTWLDVYPYKERVQNLDLTQPLFVDIGGGIGQQSIALREALPRIPNRVILQDLPPVIAQALPHDGIEVQAQDFFKPQPVQSARIYYMRNIIHDWSDEKAVDILRHIVSAMGPDSIILIDDMVVPNTGAHWQTTQLDMAMMTTLAAMERTRDQWYALLEEKAGLIINGIWTYTRSLQDSIIECVPAAKEVLS